MIWIQLGVVASAAAVLSFSSLRDLAGMCGFSTQLGWLLPVTVDAGAASGCAVWLGGHAATPAARRWARGLTVTLLAASVGGNAIVHYLTAYGLRPAWWLVVAVSAVAPAVLGAVLHLGGLVGRRVGPVTDLAAEETASEPAPPELDEMPPDPEKQCEQCGDSFVDTSVGGRGKYCAPACRQVAYRERKRQEAAALAA